MFDEEDLVLDESYGNYNYKDYIHLRYEKTDENFNQDVQKGDGTTKNRKMTKMKQTELSFKDVYMMDLDTLSPVAPVKGSGDYVMLDDYFIWFWSPILGGECVQVFNFLKSHAFGQKDYCYVSIKLICATIGRSENKIKEYLRTLENYGFIVQISRKRRSNNEHVSPFFKIRTMTPILSKELYESLDERVKLEHDKYMNRFRNVELAMHVNGSQTLLDKAVENGIDITEMMHNKRIVTIDSNRQRIKQNVTLFDSEVYIAILKELNSALSNVTFKACTIDSTVIVNSQNKTITYYAKDDMTLDVCKMAYIDELIENMIPITFDNLNGYTVRLNSYEKEPE